MLRLGLVLVVVVVIGVIVAAVVGVLFLAMRKSKNAPSELAYLRDEVSRLNREVERMREEIERLKSGAKAAGSTDIKER